MPPRSRLWAGACVLDRAANEFVFAVVGHVGSGTSEIATALKRLLSGATGGIFDVGRRHGTNLYLVLAMVNGRSEL
jgi:hypothetical protein